MFLLFHPGSHGQNPESHKQFGISSSIGNIYDFIGHKLLLFSCCMLNCDFVHMFLYVGFCICDLTL